MALAKERVAHYELVGQKRTKLHNHPALCTDLIVLTGPNSFIWTNMPVVLTELGGSTNWRFKFDFIGYLQARFLVNVIVTGYSTAWLGVQYSSDLVNWSYLCGGMNPSVNIVNPGLLISDWFDLQISGMDLSVVDFFVRVVGWAGNGSRDPSFSGIRLQLR